MAKKILKKKTKKEKPVRKNLRDIIDRNEVFRMIYSGVEDEKNFELLYSLGIRNFLMSYHYIKGKKIDMRKFADKGVKFFIDSGAHTYQNDPKYLEYPLEYWENHLKSYLEWVEDNREYIFACASFDFENLVGSEVVKRWYRDYFEPFMLRTEIPVCFVWHQNSHATWEQYCERYPYIGFSSVNTNGEAIELEEYVSKLKFAERHNTVVHGFGMTRTTMLPKLPFYTVDSTTWMVGVQYGEINFWRGTKMSRLKKEKWKGDNLNDILALGGIDKDKLLAEDSAELIKANVKAFIQAETYIQTKLKSRMYWLKAQITKNDIDDFEYPDFEWLFDPELTSEDAEVEEWCTKFNINTDLEERLVLLQDATMLLNWDNEDLAETRETIYNDEVINALHETWINQIVATIEEKIEDLQIFYEECIEGKNDKMLVYGTNFMREAKERKKYLEDEEFEEVDVTKEEVIQNLANSGMLPPPSEDGTAPEIDELDAEIFSNLDIVPIRDEKGRFLKGQKKVRKPKKLYSDKFPKMFCDTCYSAQTCPEFKQGHVCAFKKIFQKFDTRNTEDVMDAMNDMVAMNLARLQRASMFEILDGGMPTGQVSALIDQNMRLLQHMQQMNTYHPSQREVVKQVKTVKADGTVETTTEVQAPTNAGGSSILDKLFSDFGKATEESLKEEEDVMSVKEQLDKEFEEKKKNAIDIEEVIIDNK